MRIRGILGAAAAAAVTVTAAAVAVPATAGAVTSAASAAHRAAGARAPRHWQVRAVNLHAAFARLRGHLRSGPEAGVVRPPHGRAGAPRAGASGCAEPNCDLPWNGGPVEHAPKLYVLFWGPAWQTDPGEQASMSYLLSFYAGLGEPGDAWSTITSQYGDGTGRPSFTGSELVAAEVDTGTPPSQVSQSDLAGEAVAGANSWNLPDPGNDQVVVVSQSGTCFADGFVGSSCQPVAPQYCAWHSDVTWGSGTLSYTNLPYQVDAGASCGEGFVNSPGTWDGFSIVGGHEYAEAVTDPYPDSGYVDPADNVSGGEIADKCAWAGQIWGTPDPVGDLTLSDGTFAVQSLWDNAAGSCRLSSAPPQPVSAVTSLSGGGESGRAITVPAGTAVTASVTLSGANAASATGTVTYNAFANSACTILAAGGAPRTITAPGVLPSSAPVTLPPGTYYWRASYSGDSVNQPADSACGTSGAVQTVRRAPASVTTTLSGDGKAGTAITIPAGATARDSARLSGALAASAGGTVTYRVFSDPACTTLAAVPAQVTVSGGVVPSSPPVLLKRTGRYYWRAAYSGDARNRSSASACGGEILTIRAVPAFDTVARGHGKTSVSVRLSTRAAGDLLVAYLAGRGPRGRAQAATVSGAGLTWHLVARAGAGPGDAEVWYARAAGRLSLARITAAERYAGWPAALTVVSYSGAAGIGAHATARSAAGAPAASLRTTWAGSWVWAAGDDWGRGAGRTPAAGQSVVTQQTDPADTYWVQAPREVTLPVGTLVTIRDTRPTADPYNLALVEIR